MAVDELIRHYYVNIESEEKMIDYLWDLCVTFRAGQIAVFANTQREVALLTRKLRVRGIRAYGAHGGMDEDARQTIMDGFISGSIPVIVTTDMFYVERQVFIVINYHLPTQPRDYLERIGITTGFGDTGCVFNLVTSDEQSKICDVQNVNNVHIKEFVYRELDPNPCYVPPHFI